MQSQKQLDRRLEEVAKAVGGGYCRLQMLLKPAVAVNGRGSLPLHNLVSDSANPHYVSCLERVGRGTSPPSNAFLPPRRRPLALPL